MSLAAHLLHHCTIQRPVVTGQDAYNNDVAQPVTVAMNMMCRLVTKAQAILSDDRAQLITVTRPKLLLPADTDVHEGDRIVDVVLEDGAHEGPFKVKAILPRRSQVLHHITLELE